MKTMKQLLIVFLILNMLMTSCTIIELALDGREVSHWLEANQEFDVLWDLTNVRMSTSKQRPLMIGLPGKIVAEGSNSGNSFSLLAFDSSTGDLIWHTPFSSRMPGNIISHIDVIYRGTAGAAKVQAFDANNGEMMWETNLPGAHSASEIYWADGKLCIFTVDNMFFILDEGGNILDERRETFTTYLEMDNILYFDQNFSLKATDTVTRKELWQLKIDDRFTHSPIFVDGEIFLRTWTTPGFVYSIDQDTGEINWKVSHDVLSNLVISKNKVYFLDFDNYLIALDRNSGNEITKVKFSPQFDLS